MQPGSFCKIPLKRCLFRSEILQEIAECADEASNHGLQTADEALPPPPPEPATACAENTKTKNKKNRGKITVHSIPDDCLFLSLLSSENPVFIPCTHPIEEPNRKQYGDFKDISYVTG